MQLIQQIYPVIIVSSLWIINSGTSYPSPLLLFSPLERDLPMMTISSFNVLIHSCNSHRELQNFSGAKGAYISDASDPPHHM